MHVVRVSDFLRMLEVKPHQVLKAEGLVQEYAACLHGAAAFVSHQWCSRRHPDPGFHQLSVMQAMLRRLEVGGVDVDLDISSLLIWKKKPTVKKQDLQALASGCMWYDYFSVPQPGEEGKLGVDWQEDMGKAVLSIPAYVEMCQFFMVLAPPVAHVDLPELTVDFSSWRERGWCRLERIARVLSQKRQHVLLLCKEDTLYETGVRGALVDATGEGYFSVDADRVLLAPVVVALMEGKLQALLRQGDLYAYRYMLSSRAPVLRGLPGVSPRDICAPGFRVAAPPDGAAAEEVVGAFLHLYGLQSIHDYAGGPSPPIILAARGGEVAVVKAMLQCRADVHAREKYDDMEYTVIRGGTPLHAACAFADPDMVRLLLAHRADTEARERQGLSSLVSAAFGGRQGNVALLLASMACISAEGRMGTTALHVAVGMGRANICVQLIQARASVTPTGEGLSPMMWAAALGVGGPIMEALLTADDAALDRVLSPEPGSPLYMLFATMSVPRRLWGSRRMSAILGYEARGMTPLMIAGIFGQVGEVRALVRAGADPFARNSRGRTAADLAELVGLPPRSIAYLRNPQAEEMRFLSGGLDGHAPPPSLQAGRVVEGPHHAAPRKASSSDSPGWYVQAAAPAGFLLEIFN